MFIVQGETKGDLRFEERSVLVEKENRVRINSRTKERGCCLFRALRGNHFLRADSSFSKSVPPR